MIRHLVYGPEVKLPLSGEGCLWRFSCFWLDIAEIGIRPPTNHPLIEGWDFVLPALSRMILLATDNLSAQETVVCYYGRL